MKKGLVMEGGAMRGMYTAGVIDVFMENNIEFDGAVGVSAGAVFGCNFISHQIGRVIRYNKRFCNDKRFCSLHSLIRTGDLFGVDFCYNEIPNNLDIFDTDTFSSSNTDFYVTCTDVKTGKPVYHLCTDGGAEDLTWMRASASLPIVSKDVSIGDSIYLDGGMSDSIPIKYFQEIGYDKNVIILTRHLEYEKKKNKFLPLIKLKYRKYPDFITAVSQRHIHYNDTLEYIKKEAAAGRVYAIRPSEPITISGTSRNPDELEYVYQLGRKDALSVLSDIKNFLS
ncbi:MAG: patatin family protein [Lachnospiraceae bacterium]|nr:patatin family protein [Lachnospiraceae bacterium]